MEHTIEKLQAMNIGSLDMHWRFGLYPFDVHDCGKCLTQHVDGTCTAHSGLREEMIGMGFQQGFDPKIAKKFLPEIFAIRESIGTPVRELSVV